MLQANRTGLAPSDPRADFFLLLAFTLNLLRFCRHPGGKDILLAAGQFRSPFLSSSDALFSSVSSPFADVFAILSHQPISLPAGKDVTPLFENLHGPKEERTLAKFLVGNLDGKDLPGNPPPDEFSVVLKAVSVASLLFGFGVSEGSETKGRLGPELSAGSGLAKGRSPCDASVFSLDPVASVFALDPV